MKILNASHPLQVELQNIELKPYREQLNVIILGDNMNGNYIKNLGGPT